MNTLTNIFLTIVKIDSPSGNEKQMSLLLQKWLVEHDFSFRIDVVGNIYAKNGKKGAPLLLCAHMDTVEPGKNIKPVLKNGVIKSDGTTILGADNKAAIAAIMTAIEQNNTRNLEIIFSVKEETGGGIEHFPFDWIKSRKGLIFDSAKPLGGIILRSPNIINFKVEITGKAAHASTPELGINAFTPAFRTLSLIPTGALDGGKTTINIGKVSGGTGINTIPHQINIEGEIRSYSKHHFVTHLENIKNIFLKVHNIAGLSTNFTTNGYCPGYTHKKSDELVGNINDIYNSHKLKTAYYLNSGISDANILNKNGITTVNLTDGVKNPHTTHEEVAVKDLEMLSQIIVSCINKL